MEEIIINILKWLIGVVTLILMPLVFPIALVAAAVYAIPLAIGSWLYEKIEEYWEKK